MVKKESSGWNVPSELASQKMPAVTRYGGIGTSNFPEAGLDVSCFFLFKRSSFLSFPHHRPWFSRRMVICFFKSAIEIVKLSVTLKQIAVSFVAKTFAGFSKVLK
jgi:hypothetical protein